MSRRFTIGAWKPWLYANGSVLGNQSLMHAYLRYLCNFDGYNTPAMLIFQPGKA
ncbi:MAG TPA: hypothetical protein VGO08_13140 [Burkholderiales bacterium]|nr:hypothetical protein [Burkholderiales bacterium]